MKNILSEYKIHNADVLVHDDSTVDDLIDVVEGTPTFIKEIESILSAYTATIRLILFQWRRSIWSLSNQALWLSAATWSSILTDYLKRYGNILIWFESIQKKLMKILISEILLYSPMIEMVALSNLYANKSTRIFQKNSNMLKFGNVHVI